MVAARKAGWKAFSAPIYVKILGIGLLVTMLFGAVTFYQISVGVYRTHYQVYGETALSLATSLSTRIENMLRAGDIRAVDAELDLTMDAFPDLRYVVVQAPDGSILSHGFTFPAAAPPDLLARGTDLCGSCHAALSPKELPVDLLEVPPTVSISGGRLRAYTRDAGMILEITVPVGGGDLGSVRLGVSDKTIARVIDSIRVSLLWSLALCAAVGLSLALVLAYIIVKPIHNLVHATQQVRRGDFAARARVFSEDEVGQLSESFNEMARALEAYREAVRVKEAARASLIGRIVQAQEDERASIARELHDRLGQSLSKTLLTIEASCRDCGAKSEKCSLVKCDIRDMIDEVRQLAWDMRPSILDDYGIDQALHRYVDEMTKRVDFTIDYQCARQPNVERLPSQVEVTLYRIAQEAMTNIIRHARASRVSVILMRSHSEASLIVEDNGVGFEAAAVEKSPKPPLGLIGMKERAALVGGEFAVYSHANEGTTVRVRVALDGACDVDSSLDSG
jgi:signal transduction histidine kinase